LRVSKNLSAGHAPDSSRAAGAVDSSTCCGAATLIAEHKSLGRDLDSAYKQALEYFDSLAERDLPRYIIVSDFARFRIYDLEQDTRTDFVLKDLYHHIGLFGFISGYTTLRIEAQDPVNIKAAERMGKLHDRLRASGYEGHILEVNG